MAVESDDGTLLVGNGDGTDLRPVGSFPLPVGSWPDASTFAFVRDGDVWLAPADGSGSRNVSAFELGGAIDAWWSPDGRYLAVLQGETMWVLAADGSVRQRIGTGLGSAETSWRADWAPAWSPDGSWMAVDRDLDGVTAVTLVHMGDWRVVRLEGAGRPVWSPDGHHLAVSHRDANGTSEVDVTNPDGSGRTTVRSEGVPLGWLR